MTEKLKNKWLKLYEIANNISKFEPCNYFFPTDRFTFITKDNKESYLFSFFRLTENINAVACYLNEVDYMKAQKRLNTKNTKDEPTFFLQNALVCIWDDRNHLSKESYKLIKELGFSFRGRGAWLHFDKYETGYAPVTLNEKEVDILTEALGNLFMMLRAIFEQNLDPKFDEGNTLVRWFEPETNLYYTNPFKIDLPTDIAQHPLVTLQETPRLIEVKNLTSKNHTVELDWSYIDVVCNDSNNRSIFPLLLLGVISETELIITNDVLEPSYNKFNVVINALDEVIELHGKPKQIKVSDEDLHNILFDFCKKTNIKLSLVSRLPALNKARKESLSMMT